MIAADFFAAAEALPLGLLRDVTRGGGLVVVAPHPDDESLGCGGLIAEACGRGIDVQVVVVSDGTGSHPGSKLYPPARLRDLREAETCAAMAALGLPAAAIRFLRLPDRFVPTEGPQADTARDAIVAAAAETSAGAVCVTWHHDPHCDHAATATLVAGIGPRLGAARVLAYPVWGWSVPPDTDVGQAPRGLRIDITRHLVAKAEAIAAHRSQTTNLIDDDPDGFRLAADMLAHFARPFEIFLEVDAEPVH